MWNLHVLSYQYGDPRMQILPIHNFQGILDSLRQLAHTSWSQYYSIDKLDNVLLRIYHQIKVLGMEESLYKHDILQIELRQELRRRRNVNG